MKKGIICSTIIALITIIALPTFASTYIVKLTTQGSTQIALGDTVTFIVKISNIDKDHGVGAISGKIEYDQSVFELIKTANIASGEGWGSISFNDTEGNSQYGSFVTERASGDIVTDDNELMKITAKVKSNATLGSTTIKITNLSASDGNDDLLTEDAPLTVTVKNTSNNNTNNNNTINNDTNNNNTNNNNTNNNNASNNNTNNNNIDNNNTNNNNINNNTNNNNINNDNTNNNNANNNNDNKKGDTSANTNIPYAGIENYIVPTILIICGIALVFYVRYKKIKNI